MDQGYLSNFSRQLMLFHGINASQRDHRVRSLLKLRFYTISVSVCFNSVVLMVSSASFPPDQNTP